MKKVLTIDFDIIMSPSIGLYNDQVGGDDTVADIIEDYPCVAHAYYADLYKYSYLTRLITYCAVQNVPIHFIDKHHTLISILKNNYDEPVEIVNIDHHHDIGYEIKNWKYKCTSLECGNWVKYGVDDNLISKYTWVLNDNSDIPESAGKDLYINEETLFAKYSMIPFSKLDLDRLIVCASFEWIPPDYQPLFNTWIGICEEVTGHEYQIEKYRKK